LELQPPTHRHLVLVVEDDLAIRETLVDVLEEAGFTCRSASNGAEALEQLRRPGAPCPCVILLDLMMPVMNGAELHVELQRDAALARIPVILVSANNATQKHAEAMGVKYLAKPVQLDDVLEAVERACA
jgi:CheY-like chemotaxis protein